MLLDDFFADYWAREDILEEVWSWVLGRTHGHLHLAGPSGCGKTWLQRGLANGAQERGAFPLYLERSPDESFTLLVWRLVDAAEFVLDIDGEALRLAVSQALYEHGAREAMQAAAQWLTQEVEGSFLILLDGFDNAEHLKELPDWHTYPEGVYVVTAGQARQDAKTGDQIALRPDHTRNLGDMEGYLLKVLPDQHAEVSHEIVRKSGGNWRFAYYCRVLLRLGVNEIPEPDALFERLFEALANKVGQELFRTVHLEALLLLAVAQVPASLELLRSWGLPQDSLGFALFDLRELLYTDGEGSQYDALFTGEHYSLRSEDLRAYLLENSAWRDRVSDCHRRVVAIALAPARHHNPNGPVEDADFYSLAFAQHHLTVSGRKADLERFQDDPETVERCWNLGRAAREQGYDEIGLQLFLVAAQLLERRQSGRPRQKRDIGQLAEVYADCCHALTNQGRYSDGAQFGERSIELLRPLGDGSPGDPIDSLLTHCLLCLADPYLYMGYVNKAQPLYTEALDRSQREPGVDQSKVIHSLRGLARSWRAQDEVEKSLGRGQEALDLARKLTRDEGEDWAQYLFELLMEQSETLRLARESQPEGTGPLEQMSLRWEVLRQLREAESLYHKFGWPPDQELVFLYLEQSMALFDLERWAEAEERLSKAIEVINSLPASDSHPADVASLEFLRSHALALMNRIGEASGSLNNLLNPDLMGEMDSSEQALVLFFRAKILSHQGLLRQAESALNESIAAYAQTIAMGADDLVLEQISAKIYLARVRGRRGRLQEALDLCHECVGELQALDIEEDGLPLLELADAGELQAWILLHREELEEAMGACNSAALALDQIRTGEAEADVETEHSLNLITRGLIFSGMDRHAEAVASAEQAVDMESRRAQEGYEQARMWVALHRLALARIHRRADTPGQALRVAQEAWTDLDSMPGNQKNHLGLHLAAAQAEMALCYIALQRWDAVREPLTMAIGQYENEMWQSKEYLVAILLDCNRHWLDFLHRSGAPEWEDRSGWQTFFQGWNRWQAQIREEADNFFVQAAQAKLRLWVESLTPDVQKEWNGAAPQGLRLVAKE